jgi:hypothetical protein
MMASITAGGTAVLASVFLPFVIIENPLWVTLVPSSS